MLQRESNKNLMKCRNINRLIKFWSTSGVVEKDKAKMKPFRKVEKKVRSCSLEKSKKRIMKERNSNRIQAAIVGCIHNTLLICLRVPLWLILLGSSWPFCSLRYWTYIALAWEIWVVILLSPVEVSSLFEAMVLNRVAVGEVGVGVWTISSSSGASVTWVLSWIDRLLLIVCDKGGRVARTAWDLGGVGDVKGLIVEVF